MFKGKGQKTIQKVRLKTLRFIWNGKRPKVKFEILGSIKEGRIFSFYVG